MHAHNWRRSFLNSAQEKEIETRVAEFEKTTGIEIKIAVLRESSAYMSSRWHFTAFFSLIVFHAIFSSYGWLFDNVSLLGINLLALILVFALSRFEISKHLIVSKKMRSLKVKEKAFAVFHRLGVHETHHRSSALIFISLFEKSFELVLDKELVPHFSKSELENLTKTMQGHFKSGNFNSGLQEAIATFENKLIEKKMIHSPVPSELSNTIFWGHSS